MKAKPIITWLLIILIAILLMVIFSSLRPKIIEGQPRVNLDIVSLVTAMRHYESEYGVMPIGESSNVMKVLSGDNPKKIQFLVFRQTIGHPNEMVDPWLTPYQIQFHQRTNFIICSAGKDKVFGNKDDIVFNSLSNDFVKP